MICPGCAQSFGRYDDLIQIVLIIPGGYDCDHHFRAGFVYKVKIPQVKAENYGRSVFIDLEYAVSAVPNRVKLLACGINSLCLGAEIIRPRVGSGIAFPIDRVYGKLDVIVIEGINVFHGHFPNAI